MTSFPDHLDLIASAPDGKNHLDLVLVHVETGAQTGNQGLVLFPYGQFLDFVE